MKKKPLRSVRIELPKGMHYQVLDVAARAHGAPSLSKYILNSAMTYSVKYLEDKKEEIEQRKADLAASEEVK